MSETSVSRRVSYSRFGCYHVILEHRDTRPEWDARPNWPPYCSKSIGDSPARNNITDQNLLGLHVDSTERPQPPADAYTSEQASQDGHEEHRSWRPRWNRENLRLKYISGNKPHRPILGHYLCGPTLRGGVDGSARRCRKRRSGETGRRRIRHPDTGRRLSGSDSAVHPCSRDRPGTAIHVDPEEKANRKCAGNLEPHGNTAGILRIGILRIRHILPASSHNPDSGRRHWARTPRLLNTMSRFEA